MNSWKRPPQWPGQCGLDALRAAPPLTPLGTVPEAERSPEDQNWGGGIKAAHHVPPRLLDSLA